MIIDFFYNWYDIDLLPSITISCDNKYIIGKHFDISISYLFFMITIGL